MRHGSKDNRRKDSTNNAKNPCSRPFSTSKIFRIQSTDNARKSSWAKWEDEISDFLETDCSLSLQRDALNSDQNNDIYQKSNKRSWRRKEYKQFPCSSGGDFVLKRSEKREKYDASLKSQGGQEKFEHKMKGIEYPRSSELSCLSMNTTPGNVVRNGITSCPNMAWDTNVPEDGYLKLGKYMDRQDRASSKIDSDKKKGISIVEDDNFHDSFNIQVHKNRSHCSNNTPSPSNEEIINDSKLGTSYQLFNYRHKNAMEQKNYAKHVDDIPKIAAYTSKANANQRHQKFTRGKREQHLSNLCESSGLATESSETCDIAKIATYSSSANANQRHQKFTRGEREQRLSNLCESSGLALENSETSYDQLSRLISSGGWSSISSQNNSFDCDMELDEQASPKFSLDNYPEQNLLLDDDVANVGQIGSDELLARELQKQYYEEVAEALSTNKREEPMSDLYAYYTQLPYRNSSERLSNHAQHQMSNARRYFPSSEIDLETRMVAELRNFTRMDSGMRHDFLEALEAAFDQSNDSLNDFNENIRYAGATENRIDSLPQSTVQDGRVEENCAICLEVPSPGDEIRHLPCLHKFHLRCIDVWLRRKASCPVCKSLI